MLKEKSNFNEKINSEIKEIRDQLKDIDFELTKLIETQEIMISHLEIISYYIEKQLGVLKWKLRKFVLIAIKDC